MEAQEARVGLKYFLKSTHLTGSSANTESAQSTFEVLLAQFTSTLEV
jgi:hypothetical protein